MIAATYLVMGLMGAYLDPRCFLDGQASPKDSLAVLLDHQVVVDVWYFVLYLIGGITLVSLVLGVHHHLLRGGAAELSRPRPCVSVPGRRGQAVTKARG